MARKEDDKEIPAEKVTRFLESVKVKSLEEAGRVMREERENVALLRSMVETACELQGVANLTELMVKVDKERDDFVIERNGWQKMMKEVNELSNEMRLREGERMIGKWRSLSEENKKLSVRIEVMKLQLESQNGTVLNSATGDGTVSKVVKKMEGLKLMRTNEKVIGKSMGVLANTLPKLAMYSGQKEDWEEFEMGFMIRYGGLEKEVAMSLLRDHLEGDAKDALRSVPEEEKKKGIEEVLMWLRNRLSNETPFEEIELEKRLRNQNVCEELEELTRKLHTDEDVKESARRRQLLILYEGKRDEFERLLSLFGERSSYCNMKSALVELEYMKSTEMEFKRFDWSNEYGGTCWNCGGYGHKAYECSSRPGDGDGYGGDYGDDIGGDYDGGQEDFGGDGYGGDYGDHYGNDFGVDYGGDYGGCQEGHEDNGIWQGGQVGGDYGYGNGEEYGAQEAAQRDGGAGYGGWTRRW